jgi:hypothetical protein
MRLTGIRLTVGRHIWLAVTIASFFVVATSSQAAGSEEISVSAYHFRESRLRDTITFSFTGGLPGQRIAYEPRIAADASGLPIPLDGHAFLGVIFSPAHASDLAPPYLPTAAERTATPQLAIIRQVKPAGDFEGYVSFGIGLDRRVPYRVIARRHPDRISIELQR